MTHITLLVALTAASGLYDGRTAYTTCSSGRCPQVATAAAPAPATYTYSSGYAYQPQAAAPVTYAQPAATYAQPAASYAPAAPAATYSSYYTAPRATTYQAAAPAPTAYQAPAPAQVAVASGSRYYYPSTTYARGYSTCPNGSCSAR